MYAGQATGGESTKGQALCFLFVFGVPIVYAGQATGGESTKGQAFVFSICVWCTHSVRWSSDGWRIN